MKTFLLTKWTSIARRMAGGLIVIVVPLLATQVSAAEQVVETRGKSIVVQLKRDNSRLKTVIHDGLRPKIAELRAILHTAKKESRQALQEWQQTHSNDAAARFEAEISKGLKRVGDGLEAVLSQETAVQAAVETLRVAAKDALKHYGSRVSKHLGDADDYRQKAAQVHDALSKLAERYRENIDSNTPLPPDIDTSVRKLNQQLRSLEFRRKLREDAAAALRSNLIRLEQYEVVLARVGGEYDVLFSAASGQLALIADVAEIRLDRLETSQLLADLASLGDDLEEMRLNFGEIAASLTSLSEETMFMASEEEGSLVEIPEGEGLRVLREILGDKEVLTNAR
jgi:hypothetical protein